MAYLFDDDKGKVDFETAFDERFLNDFNNTFPSSFDTRWNSKFTSSFNTSFNNEFPTYFSSSMKSTLKNFISVKVSSVSATLTAQGITTVSTTVSNSGYRCLGIVGCYVNGSASDFALNLHSFWLNSASSPYVAAYSNDSATLKAKIISGRTYDITATITFASLWIAI